MISTANPVSVPLSRGKTRHRNGHARETPAAPLPAPGIGTEEILAALVAELGALRRELENVHRRANEAETLRLDHTRDLAEARRQRDGLQFRSDYLEEKLEQANRELAWRRQPWWRRWRRPSKG